MHPKLRDMKRKGPGGWRRPGEPTCPRCFYELAGLESGVCPECGAAWDRAWYAGRWPAGCGARAGLALMCVQASAIGVLCPGMWLGMIALLGRTFWQNLGILADDAVFYGVMIGGVALVMVTSAVCLVLSWRWYGLIRYGPARWGRRGVAIMGVLLGAVVIGWVGFEIASRATDQERAAGASLLLPLPLGERAG